MLVACRAWEGMYQGLHGIEDLTVFEAADMDEAENELAEWGIVASEELIYSYGLEDDYFDECEEDGCEYDITDSVCWCDRGWVGFVVKDGIFTSCREAEAKLCELGFNLFKREYCTDQEVG